MHTSKIDILQKYNLLRRPLLLDGAMGSLLQQYGLASDKFLWYSKINIDNPEVVQSIHKDYISAGAEIITTNTFRTNPAVLNRSNYVINEVEFVKKSVQIAIEARENKEIVIAGSNPPAEDCYQAKRTISISELEYNHKKHIELLYESGCDIIWNETQSHWDEIEIICKFCSQNNIPFAINIFFTDELYLLSGESLNESIKFIEDFSPLSIGFNCIKSTVLTNYFEDYSTPKSWGFYFNCGAGNVTDETIFCGIDPENYLITIKPFLTLKPLYVGACCGSNPKHIKAIKEHFDELYRN